MKWNYLFLDYRPKSKCNPLLAASALSAIGSVASSLASQQSQVSQNEEARAWQEKMWNKTNEYNSPKNQRKLYEEAGYNPYLLTTQTPTSGSSLPTAPVNQPLPSIKNALGEGVNAFFQARQSEQAQTALLQQGQQIESNIELQKMKSLQTISDTMLNLYKDGGQKAVDQFMESYAPLLKSLNFEGSPYEQMLQKQFIKMDIENNRNRLELSLREKYGEQEYQKKLSEIDSLISKYSAEVNKMKSERTLNYKSAEALGARMARDFAEAGLLGAKASEITALLPYTRSMMEDNVMLSDWNRQDKESDFVYGTKVRNWKKSKVAQVENTINFTSEHNPIVDVFRGFSKGLPIAPFSPSGTSQSSKYIFYP